MSNEQLLVTMVEDAATGSALAQELIHQVKLKDCVLKAEAVPVLESAVQKLSLAAQSGQVLLRRARGEPEPKCD